MLGSRETVSEEAVLTTIRREMLSTRYSQEEIAGFGDLSRLATELFVETLNRKAMGLNGKSNRKVIPLSEVRTMVESRAGSTCRSSRMGTRL